MKIRILGLLLGTTGVLAAPMIVTGCSQAKVACLVEHSSSGLSYAGRFKLKSGDPKSKCGTKQFDVIGMETYHGVTGNNERDLSVNKLALATTDIHPDTPGGLFENATCFSNDDPAANGGSGYKAGGSYLDPNPAHTFYAIGDFAGNAPTNDFCEVSGTPTAEQDYQKIPALTTKNPPPALGALGTSQACGDLAGLPICDPPMCTDKTQCSSMSCTKGKCDMPLTDNCCDTDLGLACQNQCLMMFPKDPKCMGNDCMACVAMCPAPGTGDPTTCHTTEQPAVTVKYEWSNIKIYTTPAAPGTQWTASVKYTVDNDTCEYDVLAFWPSVGCTATNVLGKPIVDKDGNPQPDNAACSPDSDTDTSRNCTNACVSAGTCTTDCVSDPKNCMSKDCLKCLGACPAARATGSGISPDFDIKCIDVDGTKNFQCVLNTDDFTKVPVLKQ